MSESTYAPGIIVELAEGLSPEGLDDLCAATAAAIRAGGGFGWVDVPSKVQLESHWSSVIRAADRKLHVARVDGHIVGAAQLLMPSPKNEAGGHIASLSTLFVAPQARTLGLGRQLLASVEASARSQGFLVLSLDVRETQRAAIGLYESMGFENWESNPRYARIDGQDLSGFFYTKTLAAGQHQPSTETGTSS